MTTPLDALRRILRGVISSGSGPAAPIFDEFDAAVERDRGSWYTVDGAAVDEARAVVEAADAEAQPHVAWESTPEDVQKGLLRGRLVLPLPPGMRACLEAQLEAQAARGEAWPELDPEQEALLAEVRRAWAACPELRLLQLLKNAIDEPEGKRLDKGRVFYYPDADLRERLREWLKKWGN